MKINPVGAAIPFFFLLIGVEWLVARLKRREVYRLNDTLTDLGSGIGDQLFGIFVNGALFAAYIGVYEHYRIATLEGLVAWTVAMLGKDFGYYWYHRFSHRTDIGWATHVVHHQSEEYNLAVALRQSIFTKLYAWMFYIPLAIIGVPPAIYAISSAINLLYQFWIHTRLIGKMGPLEWFLNTPSHHRVHHGTNPEYLDKNYAGILIIWDRMFGTFEEEKEEVVYGTLAPIRSWNPLWVNIAPLLKTARRAASCSSWIDKLKSPWMPPGWRPETGEVVGTADPKLRGYDRDEARSLRYYLIGQFVPIGFAMLGLLLFRPGPPKVVSALVASLIMLSLICWGGLFEGRRWAPKLESARLVVIAIVGVGVAFQPWGSHWALLGSAAFVVSLVWLQRGLQPQARRAHIP